MPTRLVDWLEFVQIRPRGPVIGPLVMCAATIDEKDIHKLEAIGVKDSKKLTPKKREELYPQIKEIVKDYKILIVEASEIDEALNSPNLNLNWLEAIKTAIILNDLKPDKAIVDCPSTNIEAYKSYLGQLLTVKMELLLEHDAERYLPVAAASILAKVTRDNRIEDMKKKYGDFGSGYPSDPKTKAFLDKNWDKHKEIFRTSWSSYKKKANQTTLNEF
ncbi:MAG: ribonuclease HII [Nanoarchaeota archaeon]|nr:ribonuclease HII [Nanoarchaeota archaeon]